MENESRLHGIFVEPKFRGQGYGKLIMNAVLLEAQTKRVTLCTGFGKISFFKRFGFEIMNIGDSLAFIERNPC